MFQDLTYITGAQYLYVYTNVSMVKNAENLNRRLSTCVQCDQIGLFIGLWATF